MSIPETTSAEAFWRYAGGKCLFESRGEAWRDIKAWLTAPPLTVDTLHIPSLSEPFLAWITSGEVGFQEREDGHPWVTNRIKKGSFFLTTGGAPYDVRWRAVSPEPYETMLAFAELPVLQRALEEVFGTGAVGLCGVIAARRLGAEQIIILGRHPDRLALAKQFGATDVVSERGDAAVERVRELAGGFGVHCVLECVGTEQATSATASITFLTCSADNTGFSFGSC